MKTIQDRLDFQICRPILGIPLFLLIMYIVFSLSFSGFGAWITEILGTICFRLTEIFQNSLFAAKVNETFISFLINVISDVASVLSFLPQTAIFFFLLKALSECGYMSRAIFAMDTFLYRFGLSGNALIPLAIGCGCSVPAILASKELEAEEQNILIPSIPFLLCNARFPVLFFLIDTFFPKHKALTAFLFYLLSVFTVFLSCLLSSSRKQAPLLILNLENYQIPKIRILLQEAKDKSLEYLSRTISLIFLCAVGLRLSSILTYSFRFTEAEAKSLLYFLGEKLSVLFLPLGFGKAPFSAALLAGFFAKENLLFVLEMLSHEEISASLTLPARISFIAFSMLYLPCFSAVSTLFKEAGAKKTALLLLRTFSISYILSWILYTLSNALVAFV